MSNPAQKANETDARERPQVAAYIAAMSADLAVLARRHGLDTLGYLLDMARLEADSHMPAAKDIRQAS